MSVTLNKLMLHDELRDLLLNTIYHELCHVLVGKYMYEHGIIVPRNDGGDPIADHEIFDPLQEAGGHAWKWLEYAETVNEKLGLRIPITPNCGDSEVAALVAANDDRPVACEIYCTECGNSQKYIALYGRELPPHVLLRLYDDTKHHKENHACGKCHGTLYINIMDENLRKAMDSQLEAIEGMRSMMRLFGVERA